MHLVTAPALHLASEILLNHISETERLAEDNNRQYALEETPLEETLAKKDEMDRLHRAMLQLEPTELALVRALFFEENSERQYAERLGISQKAVNKRWHKVRLKLKNFMEF